MTNYLKPSEAMRRKKPHLFSDSFTEGAYTLEKSVLSHCLESLTERNHHQNFEIFARKLCEREICPNLRPPTGPEGGGDGKVDAETYPVTNEISGCWFQGSANAGNERWGFAFSAKKDWASKVRSDVEGMVGTGRAYDRIFFVTSRPAPSKKLHKIQDELNIKFKVPITILDRSWIIDKVFKNKHEDLAYEHIGAGQHDESKLVVGPRDYKLQKELDALEESLTKNDQSVIKTTQSVVYSLEAAKLSRMLEKPRYETFGRFERAIELAKKYGNRQQQMQSIYERAWTDLWWFDSIDAINENYEKIEELAFVENDADDISDLLTLYHVLFGRVIQGWETAKTLNIKKRGNRLKEKIDEITLEASRPNNALHGKLLGLLFELSDANQSNDKRQLDSIWIGLSKVIDEAQGLAEFPAKILKQVAESLKPFVQANDAFDEFTLKLADFMGERAKEGALGEILLGRGEQLLGTEEPLKAIQFLGKASIHFMKDEYQEEQFKTLYALSTAYGEVGLDWASRATTLLALGRISAMSHESCSIRAELILVVGLLATTSIHLGRFVDVLNAVQLFNGLCQNSPLSDKGQETFLIIKQNIDSQLMHLLVRLEPDDLQALSGAPDVLEKLGLRISRMILLLLLGYGDTLKQGDDMPEGMSVDRLVELAELAANKPDTSGLPNKLMTHQDCEFTTSTTLLGVNVTFSTRTSASEHLLCEAHICALECFLATVIGKGTFPHANSLSVTVMTDKKSTKPEIHFEPKSITLSVNWPNHLDIRDINSQKVLQKHLINFCVMAVHAITSINPNIDTGFFAQFSNDFGVPQVVNFSSACVGNNQIFSAHASTINDFCHHSEKKYPLKENAPNLAKRG